jgi:hypothetical protein
VKALLMVKTGPGVTPTGGFGLAFSDGTKLITIRCNDFSGPQTVDFDTWNSATSFAADYTTSSWGTAHLFSAATPVWLQIKNDGTNLSVYNSLDGQHWIQFGTNQLVAAFIAGGPTQVGFLVYNNNEIIRLALLSWVVA